MNSVTAAFIIIGLLLCNNNWLLSCGVSSYSLKKPLLSKTPPPSRKASFFPCPAAPHLKGTTATFAALLLAATTTMTINCLPANALTKEELQQALQENNVIIEKRMDENFKALENRIGIYPVLTAGIAVVITAYSSNKLDDTLKRFDESKENLKDDLEAKSRRRGFEGTFVGAVTVIVLITAGWVVNFWHG